MENTKGSRLFVRIPAYVIGLLIMTLGVAISVKSNLGVSPVSSIPYTITCVVGLEMGKATILFHAVLVLLQILLLRRAFQAKNLLQIFAGILFGYFTTFCNSLMVFFPDPTNLIVRLAMMLFSTGLIAFGLFWYVPADIIPLAGEGAMLAISKTIKKPFPTVKIAFDVTMVVISLVTCLICLHSLGSVGIGTIAAAILVGMELRWITKKCGAQRDAILGVTKKETAQSPLLAIMKQEVYTVSEETSIRDALHLITEKKISGVPVTDGSQNLIGFLSDGDILRFLADVEPLFINASALQELPNFEERTKELMAMRVRDIGHFRRRGNGIGRGLPDSHRKPYQESPRSGKWQNDWHYQYEQHHKICPSENDVNKKRVLLLKHPFLFERVREMSRLFIPLSNQVKNAVSDLNALTPSVPQSRSAPLSPRQKRAGRADNMPSAHSAPQATQPQSDRHYEKYRLQRKRRSC